MSVLANWREVINTANLSPDKEMDVVSKWLIITRAAVFTMTITSGMIGGLLAIASIDNPQWFYLILALLGLAIAHASNNMTNDFFDMQGGVDTEDYTRALYAPHPVLSGLLSKRQLVVAIAIANIIDAVIMIYLALVVGWPVFVFAGLGLFISVFYVAPPLKLKHRGLGEPGVFLVWGPLMIGGTYYITTGQMPDAGIWLASLPYALIVMTVLMGKHIDKVGVDQSKGIHTLPVILGEGPSLWLNMALMISYYAVITALILTGTLGIWVALVFLALPRLVRVLKIYRQPKPEEPPEDYPVWPLWYVSASFYHNKLAGGLFLLGLLLNIVFPLSL
ncbi:MAG: prenyltransferase [Chloroflexi bacterium]|nr:prenyltransferase [Chloroflexota bacterium]